MQYFCLLIPILIGYFLDEMTVGVIFGSILWLFARELGKPRQEEHDAKLQNLEKEIELLKLRLTALEQETVHDKAEVGQARKLRAVLSEHADDIQTPPAPLHEKVEPVATADNAPVEPHIEPVASPSFSTPVSAEPSVQPEPALYADSVETPAQVSAIQEDEHKQDAPVLQTSSETKCRCRLKIHQKTSTPNLVKPLSIKRKVSISNSPKIPLLLGSCAAIRC